MCMNFELAGSEVSFVIEDNYDVPPINLRFSTDNKVSPDAIYRFLLDTYSEFGAHYRGNSKVPLNPANESLHGLGTQWPIGSLCYWRKRRGSERLYPWMGRLNTKTYGLVASSERKRMSRLQWSALLMLKIWFNNCRLNRSQWIKASSGMIKLVNFDQLAGKIKAETFHSWRYRRYCIRKAR